MKMSLITMRSCQGASLRFQELLIDSLLAPTGSMATRLLSKKSATFSAKRALTLSTIDSWSYKVRWSKSPSWRPRPKTKTRLDCWNTLKTLSEATSMSSASTSLMVKSKELMMIAEKNSPVLMPVTTNFSPLRQTRTKLLTTWRRNAHTWNSSTW